MKGTRQSLLDQIMTWVTNESEQENVRQSNTYWIHGLPGIGKTTLAHSICASLHDREQLAGAFFCRSNDPNLREPSNILPTLIYKLAIIFPSFRRIVARRLRNDPNLTPESMKDTLFLDCIGSLRCHPKHTLVFVLDALDECGDTRSTRSPAILNVLTAAATQAPWLKIIITSRHKPDIQRFLKTSIQYHLAIDEPALKIFAQDQFRSLALTRGLSSPWPKETLFNSIITRANGLFVFISTLVLALEQCEEPEEFLKAILQKSPGTSLESLHGLYSAILEARIKQGDIADFRRMIGVLLTTAPYRPLREETVADLAGLKPNLVKKWVDDLSSLLCRDEGVDGEIRVRHSSISNFLVSDHCDYQVNLGDANMELGNACLKTMLDQLCFDICKLEDSRLLNEDVKDLPSRIKENISDALQYSSRYWSNHLCFAADHDKSCVLGSLEVFFGGLYPLFWIEVLSIMGITPIGAPSLRRVISWVKVSTAPARHWFSF